MNRGHKPGDEAKPRVLEPWMHYHPKSPDASVENLLKLAGTIRLSGPAPSKEFIGGEDDEQQDSHACE